VDVDGGTTGLTTTGGPIVNAGVIVLDGILNVVNGGTGNTTGQPSGSAGGDLSGSYPNPLIKTNLKTGEIAGSFDGGGIVVTVNSNATVQINFDGTISSVTMLSDQVGNAVVDVQKATYASYPTFSSITAAAKPTLTASNKSFDNVLTGWTTTFSTGDIFKFNVNSCSSITKLLCSLNITRT